MKRLMSLGAICLLASMLLTSMAAMAQDSAKNPLTATVRETLDMYSKNLVATAEEMPAERYAYHPTPEQMTFGKSIEHVAEVNMFACAKVSDMPAPQAPKATEADGKSWTYPWTAEKAAQANGQ